MKRLREENARLREAATQTAVAHSAEIAALQARVVPDDPGEGFFAALKRVGVLNWESAAASGEERFLRGYLQRWPEALILDVGANTGQFAATARAEGAAAAIHSFEPHPVAFAQLADRAAGLDVTAEQLALGDQDGAIEMFDYADETGSQHASLYREVIEGVHRRPAAAVTVRIAKLDTIARERGIGHVGLLKIDTEGHELAVLRGAAGLIAARAIDVIQFEFNEMNVVSRVFMKDFFDLLPDYRIFRLLPDGAIPFDAYDARFMEIFAFQNIACVRRDLESGWLLAGG
ncbi:FkbM family methyltransferase [Roseomonas fluvialis]|nr:FkbM family methyltransferase [Roseomonas fluvialis]